MPVMFDFPSIPLVPWTLGSADSVHVHHSTLAFQPDFLLEKRSILNVDTLANANCFSMNFRTSHNTTTAVA